jgi:hypothetical protein
MPRGVQLPDVVAEHRHAEAQGSFRYGCADVANSRPAEDALVEGAAGVLEPLAVAKVLSGPRDAPCEGVSRYPRTESATGSVKAPGVRYTKTPTRPAVSESMESIPVPHLEITLSLAEHGCCEAMIPAHHSI